MGSMDTSSGWESPPPEIEELLGLAISAYFCTEFWQPPEIVPFEERVNWPGKAAVDALHGLNLLPLGSEGADDRNLRYVNMLRALRYWEWKYPGLVVPEYFRRQVKDYKQEDKLEGGRE